MDASANKWFANFPVIPSTMYPDQFAKLFATDESGNITEVVINSSRGMTVVATGCYWISGIVRGVA